MKKLNRKEMRAVEGGRWKCKTCGDKFWLKLTAGNHINCTGHILGSGFYDSVKWCW